MASLKVTPKLLLLAAIVAVMATVACSIIEPSYKEQSLQATVVVLQTQTALQKSAPATLPVSPSPQASRTAPSVRATIVLPSPTTTALPASTVAPRSPTRTIQPTPLLTDEVQIRQVVLNATASLTQGGKLYQSLDKVAIDGDWAVVMVGLKETATNKYVGAEGLILLVHREQGGWIAAMPGSDNFKLWLDQIPNSILSLEDKKFLKGNSP